MRSAAESLAQNVVRHSEKCAERETLVEGLRCPPNPVEASRRAAVFLRTDKRGRGQLLALPRATTRLGRSWDAEARVEDDAVSRFHAEVRAEHGRFFITDLNSVNGTFVNDQRIVEAALNDGSVVRLGSRVTLRFSVMAEDEKETLSYLHELGHYDPLTRVYNRRYLTQHLAAELAFAERHHTSISVILLDIDRFKQVNDQHGHQVGDQVLERVAAVASEQIRTEDVVARYGGEEFMVVLRETPVAGAEALAERIRRVVAETPIVKPDGQTLSVTLSAGCAALACTGSVSVEALIRLADRRLYQAKEQGRNRVTGASQPSTSVEAVALPELEPKSLVDPLDVMSRALDGLSGETKVVVGLRLLENCTFPEIAAVFGVTEERARELYESGLLQLSELLLRPEALARS